MPSEKSHKEKYEQNKTFLKEGIIHKGNHEEWEIVVMFYCAIHIIEKIFAKNNIHSKSHEDRRNNLETLIHKYDDAKSDYFLLEGLSKKARYECFCIKEKDVYNAQCYLENIEQTFKAEMA